MLRKKKNEIEVSQSSFKPNVANQEELRPAIANQVRQTDPITNKTSYVNPVTIGGKMETPITTDDKIRKSQDSALVQSQIRAIQDAALLNTNPNQVIQPTQPTQQPMQTQENTQTSIPVAAPSLPQQDSQYNESGISADRKTAINPLTNKPETPALMSGSAAGITGTDLGLAATGAYATLALPALISTVKASSAVATAGTLAKTASLSGTLVKAAGFLGLFTIANAVVSDVIVKPIVKQINKPDEIISTVDNVMNKVKADSNALATDVKTGVKTPEEARRTLRDLKNAFAENEALYKTYASKSTDFKSNPALQIQLALIYKRASQELLDSENSILKAELSQPLTPEQKLEILQERLKEINSRK